MMPTHTMFTYSFLNKVFIRCTTRWVVVLVVALHGKVVMDGGDLFGLVLRELPLRLPVIALMEQARWWVGGVRIE